MPMTPGQNMGIWARNAIIGALRSGMFGHACATKAAGLSNEHPIDADGWGVCHQTSARAHPSVLAILEQNLALGRWPEMGGDDMLR